SRCRPGSYCARRSRQRTRRASTAAFADRPSWRKPSFVVSELLGVVDEQPPVIVLDDVPNRAAALDHHADEPAVIGVVAAVHGEPVRRPDLQHRRVHFRSQTMTPATMATATMAASTFRPWRVSRYIFSPLHAISVSISMGLDARSRDRRPSSMASATAPS